MELTAQEAKAAEAANTWVREHKRELIEQYASLQKSPARKKPIAVFMAGSPGAGKTEFSETLEDILSNDAPPIARIDPDAIRMNLPSYEGGKAYVLQKAVTRAVHEIFNSLIKRKQGFILDGTLANYDKAEQNIKRTLKHGYKVNIFYVYQEPESAWFFTQAREKVEGRRIELQTFMKQYFAAKEVVNQVKAEFGKEVRVMLIVKDTQQSIKDYKINVDNIDAHLKQKYTEKTLLDTLTQ